jgi:ParB family transcriptional regulator, chromosome partitioning protein
MNKAQESRRALGKGLSTLIPARVSSPATVPAVAPSAEIKTDALPVSLPIDQIQANPHQPRRMFQQERLEELAQSIRANGVIQPLVVRRWNGGYQLVAGERRWRAARLAGLTSVPVVVQEFADERLLEITLIENIQREDLNPVETAQAFQRLIQELDLSHEEVGKRTGKDRSTITNLLRLLQLPPDLQTLLAEKRLSPGHARCLLSLPTAELQREVAERAVSQGWSVRQVERLTQKMLETRDPKQVDEVRQDPNVKAAIQEMERVLGTKVRIVEKARERGRIEIEYYSPDDLDRIYTVIVGDSEN